MERWEIYYLVCFCHAQIKFMPLYIKTLKLFDFTQKSPKILNGAETHVFIKKIFIIFDPKHNNSIHHSFYRTLQKNNLCYN